MLGFMPGVYVLPANKDSVARIERSEIRELHSRPRISLTLNPGYARYS